MDYGLIGLITSVLINLILLFGVRNLIRQNEQLEDRLLSLIRDTRTKVSTSLQKMRDIDNRQAFEKDDEVGVTFNQLNKIIEELNNEI